MSGYVANCPISRTISIPGIRPEIDMGGLMFSYDWGLTYLAGMEEPHLRSPQDF